MGSRRYREGKPCSDRPKLNSFLYMTSLRYTQHTNKQSNADSTLSVMLDVLMWMFLSPLPPSSSCWCCSTCRWLLPGAGLKTCRRPAELQRGGDLKGHVEISCGKIRLIDMNLDLWSAAHNVLSASLVDTAVDDNVHRNAFSSGGWVDCRLSKKINGSGSESEGEKLKDGTRKTETSADFSSCIWNRKQTGSGGDRSWPQTRRLNTVFQTEAERGLKDNEDTQRDSQQQRNWIKVVLQSEFASRHPHPARFISLKLMFMVELQESRIQNPSQNSSAARKQDAKEAFLCVSSWSENKYAVGESLVSLRCVRLSAHPLAAAANKRWDLWVSVQSFARSCRCVRTDGHMSARWRLPLRIYTKLPGSGLISGQGCCRLSPDLCSLLRWRASGSIHHLVHTCSNTPAVVNLHASGKSEFSSTCCKNTWKIKCFSVRSIECRQGASPIARWTLELFSSCGFRSRFCVTQGRDLCFLRALSRRVHTKAKEGRILMHMLALRQPCVLCTLWLLLISTLSAGNRPSALDFMKQSTLVCSRMEINY